MPLTLDTTPATDPSGEAEPSAYLVLAMDCEDRAAPSLRFALAGIDAVHIGRGDTRSAEITSATEGQALMIRAPDGWMSSNHARLARQGRAWCIEDLESKNGIHVDGRSCRKAALRDGSVVELGHSVFVFRSGFASEVAPAVDASPLEALHPAFRTYDPFLATRYQALAAVAKAPSSVLLLGETGTGKEVVARAIHEVSGRAGAFVPVNCGAVPADLVASELFGYRKGAFSGATDDRLGLIRSAEGGTLFLDEIAELAPASQAALLRVLQEQEVLPVGATRAIKIDLRVVAATNRNLVKLAATGEFRPDLYARLSGFRFELAPLRDRREDLGLLFSSLLARYTPQPDAVQITPKAARALFRHHWPLNIRELEQWIVTALALCGSAPIDVAHLPPEIRAATAASRQEPSPTPPDDEDLEVRLSALLETHAGNVAAVARAMGKAPMQIHRWMRRYAIDPAKFRR